MNTIFIQIASYRDSQIIPTIEDCLQNAKYPENLRFGICNQTDNLTELSRYEMDNRFKILSVSYEKSKGACWARNLIQTTLFRNEMYTLQIDSHSRFVKNWDEKLIELVKYLQEAGIEKPLITSYAPSFNPQTNEKKEEIWVMNFDRFIPEGAIFFLPASITNREQLKEPIPARFYSAHFAFTLGQFCIEIPHDPNYYFHGEEISIGVRAYTHGYDLFHPNEIILWHEYTREYRTKHWSDHPEWTELNKQSHKRNRILFGMEEGVIDFQEFGFGNKRTLKEYQDYSGIDFKNRRIQKSTLENKFPPNDKSDEWLSEFKHFIDVDKSLFIEKDYDFWCVAFNDENDKTLYRLDANEEEIKTLMLDSTTVKILRKFQTNIKPSSWVVWPHSKSKGWCNVIKGTITYE